MNSDSPLPPTGPGAPPPVPGETSGAASGAAPGSSAPWPEPTPSTTERIDAFFDSIRRTRIVRSNDRWIGGVASGLALRVGIDALLVRAAFGVLMVLSGVGFVLYAAGWALLPEQNDGRIHLQEAIRGRFDSALAGAGVLLLIGLTWRTGQFGWWGSWGFAWFDGLFWTALTIFVVYVFVTVHKQRTSALPGAQPPAHNPAQPAAQPAASSAWASSSGPSTFPAAASDAGQQPVPGYSPPSMTKNPTPTTAPFSPPPLGSTASAAPGPQGPGHPAPPVAPKASRPPVTGPGPASVGIVAGLALLTFAGLLLGDRAGVFDGSEGRIFAITLGVAAVLAGLGIVVAGFRGRSSGMLGFIALVALIIAPATTFVYGSSLSDGPLVGDETFRPTATDQVIDGYSMGAGDLTIDLSDLPLITDEILTVPIDMGVGNLVVILPEDVPASAKVRLGAGTATWQVGSEDLSRGGVGIRGASFQTHHVDDGDPAQIHLTITSGAGEILIKEES